MKRYIVFAFEGFSASGGWGDLFSTEKGESSFGTIEDAEAAAVEAKRHGLCDCVQIVDLHTGQEVRLMGEEVRSENEKEKPPQSSVVIRRRVGEPDKKVS
ncbi:MAG: hypothetical protein V1928_04765 [Parcubacteria group bacterium]